jgi:Holliday junction DNA helicase RuvA
VDVNGLGVKVFCTPACAAAARVGQPFTLHTSLVVREDSLTLFGFILGSERDFFELVQSVSGIGPKIALASVSVLSPEEFGAAVAAENIAAITQVPGIGKKGAQRLVIELKDKVGPVAGSTLIGHLRWRDQVLSGLQGLGWSSRDAEAACERIADFASADPTPSVPELMRAALQTLAK